MTKKQVKFVPVYQTASQPHNKYNSQLLVKLNTQLAIKLTSQPVNRREKNRQLSFLALKELVKLTTLLLTESFAS